MTASSATARIEVFRTGTFTPMEGGSLTYSAADLKAIADAYDPATAPAPVVVGHPKTDAPAYAWAQSFDYDASLDRLYATVGEIDPAFSEAVKAGRYKKVSLSFFRPEDAANPVPGQWYPRHIGFLGAAAPAVAGLKNAQFAAQPFVTFQAEFGDRGFEEAASLMRGLRDFLIEKFGLETADKTLPAYRIDWLSETEIVPPEAHSAFSLPAKTTEPTTKEPPAVTQPNADFAAREAEVALREERLKKRETEMANEANLSFAESLVTEGKLLPASKDKLVSILNAVPAETAVSFAAGEAAVPVAKALRELLAAQPKVVSFGALDLPADPGAADRPASFASDGKAIDAAGMELHAKAEAYQRQHPGTDYLTAVRAVS